MKSVPFILFSNLAGFLLVHAEHHPAVHGRLVRRCDNETHSSFWGNGTATRPPWGTGHEPTPTAFNGTASQPSPFGPDQTSFGVGPSSNQTTIAVTGDQNSTASTTSTSFGNTTFPTSSTSTDNATITSSDSGRPTTLPITVTTESSTTTIWSSSISNATLNDTGSPGSASETGSRPPWANTSFAGPQETSTAGNETTSSDWENTVITATVDFTPAAITPAAFTPSPEEITVTATIPEPRNHTAPPGPQETGSAGNHTGRPPAPLPQPFTIVVASNSTGIVLPTQTPGGSSPWSNSSLISAGLGSTTDVSSPQPTASATSGSEAPWSNSSTTFAGSGSSTDTAGPVTTGNGTASSTSSSSFTSWSNSTLTSAASGRVPTDSTGPQSLNVTGSETSSTSISGSTLFGSTTVPNPNNTASETSSSASSSSTSSANTTASGSSNTTLTTSSSQGSTETPFPAITGNATAPFPTITGNTTAPFPPIPFPLGGSGISGGAGLPTNIPPFPLWPNTTESPPCTSHVWQDWNVTNSTLAPSVVPTTFVTEFLVI